MNAENREAELIFSRSCDFIAGVASLDALPDATLPEVAFAGRSNVGKSSLINALTGRKALARTSRTPGRTQQLNFFDVAGRFILVDMPGYGYASVSKTKKEEWQELIRDYLRGRPSLRCVFVLVDSRHGVKDSDREMMKLLDECAAPYRIVLTKADEIKNSERDHAARAAAAIIRQHAAGHPEPVFTSAREKEGLDELRDIILKAAI